MMTEYKIKEILRFHNGRGYDSISEHGLIPVYGSGGVMGYTDKSLLEGEYILLPRKGSLNNYFYINKPFWNVDTIYAADVVKDGVDCKYLYYYFKCLNLGNLDSGSTLPSMTQSSYGSIKVKLPSYDTQKTVVKFLTTIDDKISANNKIIETSERLMREIYNYWFVQFDYPDENGSPYKSSGGRMFYDENLKREIPKGWSSATLGELYDIYQPGILSAKQCDPDGEYEVHGSNGIIGRYHKYNHEDSEIIISCRGDCGNIHRVMPKTWITGNAMVVKPKPKTIQSREYLKNMLGNLGIKNISTGSVQGQITRANLAPMKIVLPEEALLNKYAEIADPASRIVISKYLENKELEELRDWLLPMLMNGQVTIAA